VPAVSSVSPSSVTAGSSPFVLTVNGSGFTTSSVVRWNGADRATTYFGSTQLQGTITAADVAAAGSAQVTVFTPTPGGGLSNAVTVPIVPPPTLSVSTTSAAPGSPITVTLTGGLGGSTDWLAFAASSAANTSYLQWVYVGSGVTTRTWTIAAP